MFSEALSFYKTASSVVLGPLWQVFKNWWWLILPFASQKPFLFLWRWWRRDIWFKNVYRAVVLEIKIPKEILKPIRAMEEVMASLHGAIYHPPDWWEEWIDGQMQTGINFEIISVGGEIRFFIRIHEGYRESVEAAIYSQYPDVEIAEVDDYAKAVPQDMPNKDWDFWATDYELLKEDSYPILTYKEFEKEQEPVEEKRVDPIASLLEGLAKISPGEQFWIQISATPITKDEVDWIKQGEALRDKLAKREVKEKVMHKPMALEAAEILITGKTPQAEVKKEEAIIPPEMRLTPGERDIIAGIEKKISKPGFMTSIRFICLGKRDVFVKAKFRIGFTFFASFRTENLNGLKPMGATITKIKKSRFLPLNLLIPRRKYLRQRKLFRNYVNRVGPFFPRGGGSFILNTEELATLYHFPSWRVVPVPGVARVEARRKPPPELPKE